MHGDKNHRVEVRVAPLSDSPVTHFGDVCFLSLHPPAPWGYRSWSPRRNGSTRDPWKHPSEFVTMATSWQFGTFYSSKSIGREIVTLDPNYFEVIGLLFHNGDRKSHVWNTRELEQAQPEGEGAAGAQTPSGDSTWTSCTPTEWAS